MLQKKNMKKDQKGRGRDQDRGRGKDHRKDRQEDKSRTNTKAELKELVKEEDSNICTKPIVRRAHLIGSNLCLVRRTPDESLDVYYRRIGYISRKMNGTESEIDTDISNITNNSIIWRNHTIYGMGYPSTVTRRL